MGKQDKDKSPGAGYQGKGNAGDIASEVHRANGGRSISPGGGSDLPASLCQPYSKDGCSVTAVELRKGTIHIPQEVEVGMIDGDVFEPTYIKVQRAWSNSDYILWFMFNPTCNLGCRHCHESGNSSQRWVTADDIQERLEFLDPRAKFDIIVSMSDPFLCPDLENILKFTKKYGHELVLFSYFPKVVDLFYVRDILENYPNVCISYSLHGFSDEDREELLPSSHRIGDVLEVINKRRALLNRIYIFSFLITESNVVQWEKLLGRVNRANVEVCSQPFIDYPKSKIYNKKPPGILKMKQVKPNLEFLEFMYRRKFTYAESDKEL